MGIWVSLWLHCKEHDNRGMSAHAIIDSVEKRTGGIRFFTLAVTVEYTNHT